MAKDIIFQGDDKEIEIQLTEKDNVTPVDLTGVPEIVARIIGKGGNTIVKYALTNPAGTQPLTISDAVNGKFKIKYQSAETLKTPIGFIDIHGKVTFTDAAYEDNTLDRIFELDNEFEIKASEVSND